MHTAEALRVLGLEPGCGSDDVCRAHRRAARNSHPDLVGGGAAGDATTFLRAQEAFERLDAPAMRLRLDALAHLRDEARAWGLVELTLAAGIAWRLDLVVSSSRFPVGLTYTLDTGALEACVFVANRPQRPGEPPDQQGYRGASDAATTVPVEGPTLTAALGEVSRWLARRPRSPMGTVLR